MKKKTVLITGTGGRSVGAGILYALLHADPKVLHRWNVISADASPFAWGLYKTKCSLLLPFASDRNYIRKLKRAIQEHKVDAVIPGTNQEVEVISNNKDKLSDITVITNRKKLIPLMMDKFKLQATMNKMGISFIETRPLSEWKFTVRKYGFPVIVKPATNSGASRGLHLVGNEDEMKQLLCDTDKESCPCVQPYIGTPEDEYTVGVITDRDGSLIDSIVIKRKLTGLSLLHSRKIKNCTHAISTGYSQGFVIKHRAIQEFCENLALKLGSIGPLNIQLRMHNKKPYVFELHPRFSGTTPIRADVGFNEVDILLRNFLYGEKFSRLNYKYDVAAIRAFEHVIVPIKKIKKK